MHELLACRVQFLGRAFRSLVRPATRSSSAPVEEDLRRCSHGCQGTVRSVRVRISHLQGRRQFGPLSDENRTKIYQPPPHVIAQGALHILEGLKDWDVIAECTRRFCSPRILEGLRAEVRAEVA